MQIEITKKENLLEAKFDNGETITTSDSGGGIPSVVEAKMFVGMLSEYILHYLTNDGYKQDDKPTS